MSTQSNDDDFPVLTEILGTDTPVAATSYSPAPNEIHHTSHLTKSPALHALEEAETLAQIEQNVRETILRGLQQRLDLMLQVRLEETIQELLNQAMLALTEDLKHNLKLTLNDVVHRAVAQEISRLQAQRSKST